MHWLILSSLAGVSGVGFNITNRVALKDNGDPVAYAWVFELLRTLFFAVVMLTRPLVGMNLPTLVALILVGTTEFFSVYLFMKMHAFTELSISTIISRLRVVWAPLLAWFLINERLTIAEYLGIIVIFIGIAVVASPRELRADKGIKIALVFSFSSALLSIVLKNASFLASTETVVVAQGVVPLVLIPLFMRSPLLRISKTLKSSFFPSVLGGLFNIAHSFLFIEALKVSSASKVVGVTQAMTLFAVIYGVVILKEHDKLVRKLFGAVVVIVGVLFTVV